MRKKVFILRALMGAVFAVVLMRLFHPEAAPVWTVVLGGALVFLAYMMERFHDKNDKSGGSS